MVLAVEIAIKWILSRPMPSELLLLGICAVGQCLLCFLVEKRKQIILTLSTI